MFVQPADAKVWELALAEHYKIYCVNVKVWELALAEHHKIYGVSGRSRSRLRWVL